MLFNEAHGDFVIPFFINNLNVDIYLKIFFTFIP